MYLNAMEESYEVVEIYGQKALFKSCRIKRDTVPDGLFLYEIRHDDDYGCDPVELGIGILVNHYGTIITDKKIALYDDGKYRDIGLEDFCFLQGSFKLEEYYMES